jgi:hypothetical protein
MRPSWVRSDGCALFQAAHWRRHHPFKGQDGRVVGQLRNATIPRDWHLSGKRVNQTCGLLPFADSTTESCYVGRVAACYDTAQVEVT